MAQKDDFILLILCIYHTFDRKNGQDVNLHNMLDFQQTVKTISRMLCLLSHTVR